MPYLVVAILLLSGCASKASEDACVRVEFHYTDGKACNAGR